MNGRTAVNMMDPETADDFAALAMDAIHEDGTEAAPVAQVYATLAVAAAVDSVWHVLSYSERLAGPRL